MLRWESLQISGWMIFINFKIKWAWNYQRLTTNFQWAEKWMRASIILSITLDEFEDVLVSESGLSSRYFHPNSHQMVFVLVVVALFFFFPWMVHTNQYSNLRPRKWGSGWIWMVFHALKMDSRTFIWFKCRKAKEMLDKVRREWNKMHVTSRRLAWGQRRRLMHKFQGIRSHGLPKNSATTCHAQKLF